MKKTLTKGKNKVIFGVASGLAEHFDIDIVLVRVLFACSLLFAGTGLVIYLILALVLPNYQNKTVFEEKTIMSDNNKNKESIIGGLVLVCLGVIFLANNFIPNVNFKKLWPLILVVIGIALLVQAVRSNNKIDSDEKE
ncbi:MAG: phage shock protein C [Sphingobacteriales bacterium]|jgi:phage shock protein C